jgi:hypothetical protein
MFFKQRLKKVKDTTTASSACVRCIRDCIADHKELLITTSSTNINTIYNFKEYLRTSSKAVPKMKDFQV